MKKFWVVLLSLGLVMAFSVSTLAADVKFSAEYYVTGLYLEHAGDLKDPATKYSRSTSLFFQRFRLGTDFVVSPCLRLVTRMDIMERTWEPDAVGYYGVDASGNDSRNVDFDMAYIDYTSPIGRLNVGYMLDHAWGTIWGNRAGAAKAGQIKYILPVGPVSLVYIYAKEEENDYSVQQPAANAIDADFDSHRVGPIFTWKGNQFSGETGLLFIYNRIRNSRLRTPPYKQNDYIFQPYFRAKAGPVSVQGEINWALGEREFEVAVPGDDEKDISSFSAWLDADANFGTVSIGGSLAFVQGQDPDDIDDIHNTLNGGCDWDPCLIMFNNTTLNTWHSQLATYSAFPMTGPIGPMQNAYFVQGRIGVKPIPQLSFNGSFSYAAAHELPASNWDHDYGCELDITGTYKITNNLSYMLGGAYLWTGDYFNAGNDSNDLNDNYMIINKLTLVF